uniref:Uncharacterized protein n=1 Tax=Anopheles quadriannulatus TaxID=34691 RepID=A0A182WR72_ANOQN
MKQSIYIYTAELAAGIFEGSAKNFEAAATKIQAAFRGHKVRREMKQGDGVTGAEGQQKQDAQQTEREPTKEELEAEFDPNDQGKCRGVV